jgi:ribosomal protein L16/L10AE
MRVLVELDTGTHGDIRMRIGTQGYGTVVRWVCDWLPGRQVHERNLDEMETVFEALVRAAVMERWGIQEVLH